MSLHCVLPYSRVSTVNKYLNVHRELSSNSFPQAFQRPAKGGELEVSIISGVNFTFSFVAAAVFLWLAYIRFYLCLLLLLRPFLIF